MSRFREARGEDVDTLVSLMRAYYAEDGYPFHEAEARAALEKLVTDSALGRIWVAFDERKAAVGYVVMTLGYSLEYRGRDAFVDEVFIVPAERGRGLGGEALDLVEKACRLAGVRALHLEVEPEKDGAIELYRRLGFVDHERRLMTKWLG
jgi:ribosomal protein S18 acetylase RimI-like enzyme